jgi:cytoskeletal protein CcmA (bactofilin family)
MEVEGSITFTGTMKISGKVKGDIFENDSQHQSDSTVIIEGTVNGGSITADHVVITGIVAVTKIVANKSLIVISGGRVDAEEIFYGSVTSDDSAIINGLMRKMAAPTEAAK